MTATDRVGAMKREHEAKRVGRLTIGQAQIVNMIADRVLRTPEEFADIEEEIALLIAPANRTLQAGFTPGGFIEAFRAALAQAGRPRKARRA